MEQQCELVHSDRKNNSHAVVALLIGEFIMIACHALHPYLDISVSS
jgi:hypothetical protein